MYLIRTRRCLFFFFNCYPDSDISLGSDTYESCLDGSMKFFITNVNFLSCSANLKCFFFSPPLVLLLRSLASIDSLTIPSRCGKGVLRRVTEVFDCWFESGSMPYAQVHYPFENKKEFEESFPADFIAEGIDQTRGW